METCPNLEMVQFAGSFSGDGFLRLLQAASAERMPQLRTFGLVAGEPFQGDEAVVREALLQLKQVRTLAIGACLPIHDIIEPAMTLPSLRAVRFLHDEVLLSIYV